MRRSADIAGASRWRGLIAAWALVIGMAIGATAVLLSVGAPVDRPGRPAAAATAAATAPGAAAGTQARPGDSIDALLSRAQAQIAAGRDDRPPGDNATETLKRLAAALPAASAAERQRVKILAAGLFERAKAAADEGRVDQEQRFLALGSMFSTPPEITPAGASAASPEAVGRAGPAASGPSGPPAAQPQPSDITPNAAEADQAAVAQGGAPAGQPTAAPPAMPGAPEAEAGAAPPPAEQASGTSLSIHLPTNSASAEAKAKELAARLDTGFARTETFPESDLAGTGMPGAAVVRYFDPADHAMARHVGQVLGGMGYRWQLKRRANEQAASSSRVVEVWLPAADRPAAPEARPRRTSSFALVVGPPRRRAAARWHWFFSRWF